MQSTKISGLAVDKEYTFHLTLRTSAGTFNSDKVTVMTHKMTDLSGITVTPGVLPAQLRESLSRAVERIGGKIADTVRIDTTHFVTVEGRGIAWEKAVEMNIPVVRPEWVEGCEAAGRIVGVRQYYLDADPRQRQVLQAQPEPEPARTSPQPSPRVDATTEGSNSANGDKELPQTPPAKDEPEKGEESRDEEEEEHVKEKEEKEILPAEQKVRVEDRDQHKVAVRPAEPAPEPEKEKESEGDGEAEGGREEEERKGNEEATGTLTPGNASFQDVAL
jgi:chitin biosynthesis protein CHS5